MRRSLASTVAVLAAAVIGLTAVLLSAAPSLAAGARDGASAAGGSDGLAIATFGSGCFWCTESDFDKLPGVVATISGYMGGTTDNPTYESVSTGRTGHAEVVQVTYDPARISYRKLLDYYWRTTDVLDPHGQFCDRGNHYRPVIFTHTPEQRRIAERSKERLDSSGRFSSPIAVEIADAARFTAAEDYHQDYYLKNPVAYKRYRTGCGRDARILSIWGDVASQMTH